MSAEGYHRPVLGYVPCSVCLTPTEVRRALKPGEPRLCSNGCKQTRRRWANGGPVRGRHATMRALNTYRVELEAAVRRIGEIAGVTLADAQ